MKAGHKVALATVISTDSLLTKVGSKDYAGMQVAMLQVHGYTNGDNKHILKLEMQSANGTRSDSIERLQLEARMDGVMSQGSIFSIAACKMNEPSNYQKAFDTFINDLKSKELLRSDYEYKGWHK